MNEITRRGLAKSDDEWVEAEGYIICWEQQAYPDKAWAVAVTYFWGNGPPGGTWGGWESARHAHVFPSYATASAGVSRIRGDYDRFGIYKFEDSDARIVRVRIQRPVVVLDDMPYDILQKLANL